ncbi:MAG TPA: DUF3040 domain-containing protein [Actinospica sp.]|nr:DUF3040 domain-containing protein [Actinospica sp.]
MALSARDRRIITAIEQELEQHDPRWKRRFTRRHRRFERMERRRLHPVRRRALVAAAVAAWIALLLVLVGDVRDSGLWPVAALATTAAAGAAMALAAARWWVRRRRFLC